MKINLLGRSWQDLNSVEILVDEAIPMSSRLGGVGAVESPECEGIFKYIKKSLLNSIMILLRIFPSISILWEKNFRIPLVSEALSAK